MNLIVGQSTILIKEDGYLDLLTARKLVANSGKSTLKVGADSSSAYHIERNLYAHQQLLTEIEPQSLPVAYAFARFACGTIS